MAVTGAHLFGQTGKGRFMVGSATSIMYNSNSSKWKSSAGGSDGSRSSQFIFYPSAGYFPFKNFAAGIGLALSFSSSNNNEDKSTDNSHSFVPFARYYFGNMKTRPFLHAGIGFGGGHSKSEYNATTSESSYTTSSYELSGGLACFLNENISIDFKVGFNSYTDKNEFNSVKYTNTENTLGIGFAFNYLFF